MILEACVENFLEAAAAQKAGAGRIELCENLAVGGTTPSYGTIQACCRELKIPVAVMIRPRGGDFYYSGEEFRIMQEDIRICRELGVQAVVFGILTVQKKIDTDRTKLLTGLAYPMQTVFHKAFDEVPDPFEALERLIETGITRILTSGTKRTALEGHEILNKLIKQAAGRITIMPAGNITHENVKQVQALIPAGEYHGRRILNFVC